MDSEEAETVLENRVSLPEPDVDNITVLTRSLPNEPILPWHHFDSPWLEREEELAQDEESFEDAEESAQENEAADSEQLTLALEVSPVETTEPDETSVFHPEAHAFEAAPLEPETTEVSEPDTEIA